jgi:preprotein translocase subunit SecD
MQFSRIQAALILLIVLATCGFTVPNFVSDQTLRGWPDWAQRRITLAPELQGGTSMLLEVDRAAVRKHALDLLFREVRSLLHDAHINMERPVVAHNGSIEVRPLQDNFEAALAKLRALSQEFNGVRSVDLDDAGGGLIRVTPTDAGVAEYEGPMLARSMAFIRERLSLLSKPSEHIPATVEREGANRLRVQMPRLGLNNSLLFMHYY